MTTVNKHKTGASQKPQMRAIEECKGNSDDDERSEEHVDLS